MLANDSLSGIAGYLNCQTAPPELERPSKGRAENYNSQLTSPRTSMAGNVAACKKTRPRQEVIPTHCSERITVDLPPTVGLRVVNYNSRPAEHHELTQDGRCAPNRQRKNTSCSKGQTCRREPPLESLPLPPSRREKKALSVPETPHGMQTFRDSFARHTRC